MLGDSDYQLAIGMAPEFAETSGSSMQHALLTLYSHHRALLERVMRVQSTLALWSRGRKDTNGLDAADTACGSIQWQSQESMAILTKLQPLLDAVELETARKAAEQRAETAEARVRELERRLADARRLAPSTAPTMISTATTAPDARAPASAVAAAKVYPAAVTPDASANATTPIAAAASSAAIAAASPPPSTAAPVEGESGGCLSLLLEIRRELAADVVVPPHLTGAMASLRGALHRSLALLSEDLYSDDVHAVSELLQNADDNAYAVGVEPAWSLHCSGNGAAAPGAMAAPRWCWTSNNELGMRAVTCGRCAMPATQVNVAKPVVSAVRVWVSSRLSNSLSTCTCCLVSFAFASTSIRMGC